MDLRQTADKPLPKHTNDDKVMSPCHNIFKKAIVQEQIKWLFCYINAFNQNKTEWETVLRSGIYRYGTAMSCK